MGEDSATRFILVPNAEKANEGWTLGWVIPCCACKHCQYDPYKPDMYCAHWDRMLPGSHGTGFCAWAELDKEDEDGK